ncbi:hypothetical protein J19TS2_10550 [Cohnella xylanilytica]|nr:hypothetical protein J19TS2_10550 [Cohnella xylanilytica]
MPLGWQIGFTDRRHPISGDRDGTYSALLFHRDENGAITGGIVVLDERDARMAAFGRIGRPDLLRTPRLR